MGRCFVYSSARDTFEQFGAQAIPLGLLPELHSPEPLKQTDELTAVVIKRVPKAA
jgi:hypothetical protein